MAFQPVPAHRIPSLPIPTDELLDMLRTENDDILDFPQLEWVLDAEVDLPLPSNSNPAGGSAEALSTLLPPAPAPPPAGPAATGLLPGWSAAPIEPQQGSAFQPKVEPVSSGEHSHSTLQPPQLLLPQLPKQHSSETLPVSPHLQLQQAQQPPQPAGHIPPAARSSFTTRVSLSSSHEDLEGADEARMPPKKKRTRNAEQMAQNRVAQQKYRERKKAEHEQLQQALDQLTAQLAAMKALEARAAVLQGENAVLMGTASHQAERIAELTRQVEMQAAELVAAKQEAAQAASLVSSQQAMILDQHKKLKLQEEVIEALRGRLKDKMDLAFEGHDPTTVCQRMIAAVRAALAGAKNVEGFQEVLERLPDDVVTAICKSILCEVKNMWPELAARLHSLKMCPGFRCGPEVCAS